MAEYGPAIAGFIASGLGALLAAILGVRLALRQYRDERALDRRLDWYARMSEVARILTNRSAAFEFHVRQGDAEEVSNLLPQLADLAYKFQELALFAEFYAAPDTVAVLQETITSLNGLASEMARTYRGAPNSSATRDASRERSMRIIKRASEFLARDIRRELGLEPLPQHRSLPNANL